MSSKIIKEWVFSIIPSFQIFLEDLIIPVLSVTAFWVTSAFTIWGLVLYVSSWKEEGGKKIAIRGVLCSILVLFLFSPLEGFSRLQDKLAKNEAVTFILTLILFLQFLTTLLLFLAGFFSIVIFFYGLSLALTGNSYLAKRTVIKSIFCLSIVVFPLSMSFPDFPKLDVIIHGL